MIQSDILVFHIGLFYWQTHVPGATRVLMYCTHTSTRNKKYNLECYYCLHYIDVSAQTPPAEWWQQHQWLYTEATETSKLYSLIWQAHTLTQNSCYSIYTTSPRLWHKFICNLFPAKRYHQGMVYTYDFPNLLRPLGTNYP